MKKYLSLTVLSLLLVTLVGCHHTTSDASKETALKKEKEEEMRIQVSDGFHTIIFQLNDSKAALSLYQQLPLTLAVEDYADDEKIFYPKKLDTTDAIPADAKKGTLAYFSPWGDVVMYYRDFGSYDGLYELGKAISGTDEIEALSGTIEVTKK